MATWKRLHGIAKSGLEIDLDTIAFMHRNGNGSEIHFNNGRTLKARRTFASPLRQVLFKCIRRLVGPV